MWPVVLCGVAGVALFAVVGVGLAALLGRWWAVMVAAVVFILLLGAFWHLQARTSAVPNPDLGAYAQGAGRIDVTRAIGQRVYSSPPSLSFGRQAWPHDDDAAVQKTVTYRNTGTAPVTLRLALDVRGPDGSPAPDGMFTVNVDTVKLPEGGEAQVTVTGDTRVGGPDGLVSGHLVATASGVIVSTPLAVDKEGEKYDVTAVHTDRAGAAATRYNTFLVSLDRLETYQLYDADGTATVRVPKGRYMLSTAIFTDGAGGSTLTELVQPSLTVDAPQTVPLHAATGKPLAVTVEQPSAAAVLVEVSTQMDTAWGRTTIGVVSDRIDSLYTAQVGPDTAVDGFTAFVNSHWIKPDAGGGWQNSPYSYHLVWRESGRMFTGIARDMRDRDLAAVRAEHAAQGNLLGAKASTFEAPEVAGGWAPVLPFRLPFTRTEYYNTDPGLRWVDSFSQTGPGGPADDSITWTQPSPASYRAGPGRAPLRCVVEPRRVRSSGAHTGEPPFRGSPVR